MVVSASRIEALCTMKRDMIQNGIPEDQIGLIYTAPKDDKYSEKATADNDSRPFLLCSHQDHPLPRVEPVAVQHLQQRWSALPLCL